MAEKQIDAMASIERILEHIQLPLEEEYYFYRVNQDFKKRVDQLSERIQQLLQGLHTVCLDATNEDHGDDTVEEVGERIVDGLLRKVDLHIDRYAKEEMMSTRNGEQEAMVQQEQLQHQQRDKQQHHVVANDGSALEGFVSYMRTTLKEKPQIHFAERPNNDNCRVIPRFEHLDGIPGVDIAVLRSQRDEAIQHGTSCPHPLHHLLDSLPKKYSAQQLEAPKKPRDVRMFEEVPYTYIDTVDMLQSAADRLKQCKEIAVDLEAHNYRSFQGFCCLIQMSTDEEDLIIDAIALRSHIGRVLGGIFADEGIVKVLHGSQSDLAWLQRDFGIYMCNLFDTGLATRALSYPANGLAYVLERFCGFKAEKKWQLADWRIRPLPEKGLLYARADTHFLLHCYDQLRIELEGLGKKDFRPLLNGIEYLEPTQKGIFAVLEASRSMCYDMYEKELMKPTSFVRLYKKLEPKFGVLTWEQLSVFESVYSWRDAMARLHDESLGYILPQAQLFAISKSIPRTMIELQNIIPNRSSYARKNASTLKRHIELGLNADRVQQVQALYNEYGQESSVANKPVRAESKVVSVKRSMEEQLQEDMARERKKKKRVKLNSKSEFGDMLEISNHRKLIQKHSAITAMIQGPQKTEILATSNKEERAQDSPPQEEKASITVQEVTKDENPEVGVPTQSTVDSAGGGGGGDAPQDDNDEEQANQEDLVSFLPIPISQMNNKGNKFSNNRHHKQHVRPAKKKGQQQSQNPPAKEEASFDASEAVNKYAHGHRPRRQGRGSDQQGHIPEGMFNPHAGLTEQKHKSRRSTTAVRSGNRMSIFKKR